MDNEYGAPAETPAGLPSLSVQEIRSFLENRDWSGLRDYVSDAHPVQLTNMLRRLEPRENLLFFRGLDRGAQKDVFRALSMKEQNQLFRELTSDESATLLNNLEPDDRTALFEELPAEITEKALNQLEGKELEIAREMLGYPEESIGRLMSPGFVAVRPDWTVKQAMEHIRALGHEPETISSVFVTDEEGRLKDALRLRRLIHAEETQAVRTLMDETFVSVQANDDQEQAVRVMEQFSLKNLPVVDPDGYMLGVVTLDDVLGVAEEEASEDFQRLGGSEPLDKPYFDLSVAGISRKRVGWLLLLFLGGTLTSSVIGAFEEQLNRALTLSFFIPLLIGTGGNAGAQSVSTIIRELALGTVRWEFIGRVMLKEFLIGLLVGGILGIIGFFFVQGVWGATEELSVVVALTLPVICTWANVVAGVVPIVADGLGIDPTVISAPLITTIVDATGLIIYFSIATWVLGL